MRGRKPNNRVNPGVGSPPACPAWLDEGAREEWGRVVPLLSGAGVVQQVDLAILAAYCSTWSLWAEVSATVNAGNVVLNGKLNPAARYSESLLKQLRGLLDQLGFTPAARRQVLQGESGEVSLEELLQ